MATLISWGLTLTSVARPVQARQVESPVARVSFDRPASDAVWEKAICRGSQLLAMMQSSDSEAGKLLVPPADSAASKFVNFPYEFDKWGYSHGELEDPFECDMEFLGIKRALDALHVSSVSQDEGGPIACYLVQHTFDRTVDGKEYKATRGELNMALNAQDGVLIFLRRYSPQQMAAKAQPPITNIPDLKRSSDILWGQWTLHTKGNVGNVRYLISNAVTNVDTGPIIQRAIESVNASPLKKWPGVSFSSMSEQGRALLGSPNGIGLGYLLVQHKAQLGNKYVTRIDVFAPDEGANPTMIFHIDSWTG
ncbi:hypothetical protein BU24DRAFT_492854 [Aaosphaeria arxii CBS 175.79]|uniref:Uncharacterized protein n=1 Tax=Aaosphaeria arxii CBS 175.79 TaxID=1450172 RepID=A0A6A5XMS1_9PLEO|nr:uncharacterized protein BU24DRAFT_492854 [Aaosphaeria arxii CBS 175.79]KAF2014147.1 hypothetical protein BU24DRAFT_492854 [Aaosphaeria arxii CBS 175.79]